MSKFFILLLLASLIFQDAIAQINILTDPIDDFVCPGDTAIFQVTVSPVTDSVKWQFGPSSTGPWDSLTMGVDGVKTTKLMVFNSQFYNGKYFRIVAIDAGLIVDSSASAKLTQLIPPSPVITPMNTVFCAGKSDTLDAGPGYVTYLWSSGDTNQSIIVSATMTYYVTVTDGNGCTGTSSSNVTVNPNPPPVIFTPAAPKICTSGDTTTVLGTTISYNEYLWSTQDTSDFITVSEIGNIGITVTAMNGCTATGNVIVAHFIPPPIAISPSLAVFCAGEEFVLTASNGNYKYKWSQGDSTQAITVNNAATYSVTVTDNKGCKNSASITTTVHDKPHAAFSSNPPLTNIVETQDIQFLNNSSPATPGQPIINWSWNFGICASPGSFDTAVEQNPPLVSYSCPGLKNICLTVTDTNGCIDLNCSHLQVNAGGGPTVDLSMIGNSAKCLGDMITLKATTNTINPINFTMDPFLWEVLGANPEDFSWGPVIVTDQSNANRKEERNILFNKPGNFIIMVTATQHYNINPDSVLHGEDKLEVFSGYTMPAIDLNESYIPDSICEAALDEIRLILKTPKSAEIEYSLNGVDKIVTVSTGELVIPIEGLSNQPFLVFHVDRIEELGNTCINTSPDFLDTIFIKSRPVLNVLGDTIVCKGIPGYLIASGADDGTYAWKNSDGTLIGHSDSLYLNADIVGIHTYTVEGSIIGCVSKRSVDIEVKEIPTPDIEGSFAACKNQVVTYASNSDKGNQWGALGGTIIGPSTSQLVSIQWNSNGSIKLTQKVGDCVEEAMNLITVSQQESPPYDTLVYLDGGGIILYPNPDLKENLCYKWYKDGQLLPDSMQGCVVGPSLPKSELERYTVKVTYCRQDTSCAQEISYRGIEQVPLNKNFELNVVPNPNSGVFTVEYTIINTGDYTQYLFDSSGRLLKKKTMNLESNHGHLEVAISNVASGIYFIKLINSATGEYRIVPVSIVL